MSSDSNSVDTQDRKVEVLRLAAEGLASKRIVRRRRVSEKTAKTHVSNILAKLGV